MEAVCGGRQSHHISLGLLTLRLQEVTEVFYLVQVIVILTFAIEYERYAFSQ